MIVSVMRLTRWELFKLRKRWMPWVLLIILVGISQSFLWSMFYSYNDRPSVEERTRFYLTGPVVVEVGRRADIPISCIDIWEGTADAKVEQSDQTFREDSLRMVQFLREKECPGQIEEEALFEDETRQAFVLPNSLSNAIGLSQTIGIALIIILAASSMGIEYGWGTLRTALTRGVSRWEFLGAKGLSTSLLVGSGLFVVALTIVPSSLIAASLLSDSRVLADAGEWSTVAVMFGKAVYGLMPYAILALLLSVLTSSSSKGIAIGLAYFFAELILVQILGGLFDWFENISDFLLGPSVTAWMVEAGVQTTRPETALIPLNDPPSQVHAFLVLTAYMVIAGVAVFWLFQRRDITGEKGN